MQGYWKQPILINQRGQSHLYTGTPCQDAYFIKYSKDKNWIVAVVCDGAGSASRSLEGAKITTGAFGKALLKIAEELESRAPGHWVNDEIIQCIINIRQSLRNIARSDSIADFHTTVVAALIGPTGGVAIHIGDGAIFGGNFENIESDTYIDNDFFMSMPENGEYANETFFLTESDWVKHLRITPLPSVDWIALGSDGGCAIALKNDQKLREEFLIPLFSKVFIDQISIDDINSSLASEKEFLKLTNDDITLLIIISNKEQKTINLKMKSKEIIEEPEGGSGEAVDPVSPQQILIENILNLIRSNKIITFLCTIIIILLISIGIILKNRIATCPQCPNQKSIEDLINQTDKEFRLKKPSNGDILDATNDQLKSKN